MGRVQSVAIIAEDNSDVDAIKIFVQRISRVSNISFRKKVGHGGGKVISKCLAWSNDLYSLGCDLLIVVHDQDSFEFTELQRTIENRLSASCFRNRIICIPTQELEAWFLGDPQSIKSFFKLKRLPKIAGHPESINSPKEFLREQVKRHSDGSARDMKESCV